MALKVEPLPTSEQNVFKFSLEGRLDGNTSNELEAALRPALSAVPKSIVLNMHGLDFISSAGIRVLIETQNKLSGNGGKLLMVDLQPQIMKVMEIIKALPGITVFRNIQEMDDYLAMIQRKAKAEE